MFALRPNQVITPSELLEAVWGDEAPASGERIIPSYIYRLRQILRPAVSDNPLGILGRERAGYRLRIDHDQVDLLEVERRLEAVPAARDAGDLSAAADLLASALSAWRGEALGGLPGPYAGQQRQRLSEMRLNLVQQWVDIELQRQHHNDVIPELTALRTQFPFREQVALQLMTALSGSGRRAEALQVFTQTRAILVEELGIEPGPDLTDLHTAILRGKPHDWAPYRTDAAISPTLPAEPNDTAGQPARTPLRAIAESPGANGGNSSPPSPPIPPKSKPNGTGPMRMDVVRHGDLLLSAPDPWLDETWPAGATRRCDLPAVVPHFVGRSEESRRLVEPDGTDGVAPRIDLVSGMPGIGKTALALRAAHLLAERYPDAQLFLDLHTHSTDGRSTPVGLGEALTRLLHVVGVREVPVGIEDRAALWRSVLANRRAILVFDDVADTAQLRPLLPGTGTCRVIVTSRRRLVDLDVTMRLDLDVLPADEGIRLFHLMAGEERVRQERTGVAEIVESLGGLPLALRIMASRLAQRPGLACRDLIQRARRHGHWLPELRTENRTVEDAFMASCHHLPPFEQRMIRAAAGCGGTIQAATVAGRIDLPTDRVEESLESLVTVNLLQPAGADRYAFHPLIREFAAELDAAPDNPMVDLAGT